jgi:hypothetical protein
MKTKLIRFLQMFLFTILVSCGFIGTLYVALEVGNHFGMGGYLAVMVGAVCAFISAMYAMDGKL